MTASANQHDPKIAIQLPAEWWQWIQENQSLHVPDAQLIEMMVRESIAMEIATSAVEAVRTQKIYQTSRCHNTEAQLLAKLESMLAINCQLAELAPNFGIITRCDRISKQEFLERYYATNTPVILTGMMQDWAAMSDWTPEYLQTNYGSVAVEIQTGRNSDSDYEINTYHHKKIVNLSEYVDMLVTGGETNDYYMVANNANLERAELKSLLKDIVFPDFLNPNHLQQQVFLWFGPAGTITPLHHDALNLIMAHICGRKRWRLISPNYTPLLYNYIGVFSKVDLEKPDYEKYPLFKQVHVMETVLEPGEIIFIPVGWWHQVKALDISLSISFTNFIFPNSYTYQKPHIPD
ncbi:MAG: cupin-like domain-containing protein [Goleter apudmare HA4340-LM2]|jgi:ribosomal protein L16 Arg81 hydroxylase|nr:cupin-like domain-containing protein [Goleter apudmare HA4340-LM2]